MKRSGFLVIVTAIIFPVLSYAQSGPSYDETLSFLRSKVQISFDNNTRRYSLVKNSKCNMTLLHDLDAGFNGSPIPQNTKYTFNLEDLDPSKIIYRKNTNSRFPNQGWVQVEIKEQKHKFRIQSTQYISTKSFQKGWVCSERNKCTKENYNNHMTIEILPPNHDNGPRVVRALQHLVKLCGGKEELF